MSTPRELRNFIDGRESSRGTTPIVRENPTRPDEIVGSVIAADVPEAGRAVEAALRAGRPWAGRHVRERIDLVARAWQTAVESTDLPALLTAELGKPLADSRNELEFASRYCAYVLEHAEDVLRDREQDGADQVLFRKVPYGVVVAIVPWNVAVLASCMKIIPALVSGNTAVVKPSPLAPLTATSLLREMAKVLPRGVLNVVNGDGDVGNALVSNSAVGKIAFTGSNRVAGLIQSASAEHSTPALFELGGNDVAIVMADAPLSDAHLARLVMASFLTSGQVCMAVKRILVADTIFDDFLTRYLEIAEQLLLMGDPATNTVTVGPLVTAAHRAKVTQIVDQSVGDDGETIPLGRSLVEEHRVASGYFMHPRCVVGAPLDSRLWAEEQFGPVVPIRTFSSVEEAILVANDTPFGLCASLWTADEDRAFDVARQLDVGTVFVNAHGRSGMSLTTPFGGVKASGHGRELGLEGIEEFAQTQVISCLEQPHSDDLRQASRYA